MVLLAREARCLPDVGKRSCGILRDKGKIMFVVTPIVGVLALVAMAYLAVLLLRGGERR